MVNRCKYCMIVIIAVGLLASCKANPQEPAVQNKANSNLEQLIFTTRSPSDTKEYSAPDTYKASFPILGGKSTAYIDAEVIIPNADKYPVVKIILGDITQAQADHYMSVLFPGKTLYVPREEKDLSKEEILKRIADLKLGNNSDLAEADPEAYKAYVAPEVDRLQKLLKTAPETSQRRIADGKFQVPSLIEITSSMTEDQKKNAEARNQMTKNQLHLVVEAELGKSNPAFLGISKGGNKRISLQYANIEASYTFPSGKIKEKLDNTDSLKMPVNDAKALAERMVTELGFSGFYVDSVGYMPSGKDLKYTSAPKYENLPKCFVLHFTRCVNGVPCTFVDKNRSLDIQSDSRQYRDNWPNELITVYVDDTGILGLTYTSPVSVVGIVNDNVALMPFDEIMNRFEKQLKVPGAWNAEAEVVSREIHITKIRLGMARIARKDKPDEYLLVPVWDFFGYCVKKYSDKITDSNLNSNNETTENIFGLSYLTINAIDGSIIDRSLGY